MIAFVGTQPGPRATAAELDALCVQNIARFKRPKDYYFLDSLPKNNEVARARLSFS